MTDNRKFADALEALMNLQNQGRHVFQSAEFGPDDRRRLLRAGFLQEIIRGWVMTANPGLPGDSTLWYAAFWEFCRCYCDARFGSDWHLSPEQSLLLHAEYAVVPAQVVIYSTKGTNNTIALPFKSSLYDLKQKDSLSSNDAADLDGLTVYSAEAALIKVPASFYARFPIEAETVLISVADPQRLTRRLAEGEHAVAAARLTGALLHLDEDRLAEEVQSTMKTIGIAVQPTDPFVEAQQPARAHRPATAIEGRLRILWKNCRAAVLETFPPPPGLPADHNLYLQEVDRLYRSDAYHSLSIEGYHVSEELVERVRSGAWSPERDEKDRKSRDALAARGYWQAFQQVRLGIAEILGGAAPGELARREHATWYKQLFQPFVTAGILTDKDLDNYRNDAVYLRGSRYVPPRWEAVRDAMPVLFDLLAREPEAAVRAVFGHWLFGYIHPYPDGNGRLARFLMNTMLASGGYPWTIIRVDDRADYMAALETASVESNIEPFARFIGARVRRAMALAEES